MSEGEKAPFRLFSASDDEVLAECGSCGRVLKVPRANVVPVERGFDVAIGVLCPCGRRATAIRSSGSRRPSRSGSTVRSQSTPKVKCPKCGSEQVTGGSKGFGLGKAVAGGILLGPVGLLGGMIGRKKVMVSCLNCGKRWAP